MGRKGAFKNVIRPSITAEKKKKAEIPDCGSKTALD